MITIETKINLFFLFFISISLNSCVSANYKDVNNKNYKEIKTKLTNEDKEILKGNGGYYKVGSPYKIDGKKYTPKVNENYKETGLASWYGSDFHNKKTANGEVFDKNKITAAHKTLPLPSIVRVTNLENGKSIKVRVNDRGPFVGNRIIDLSEKTASKLGIKEKGVARVKVEYLKAESNIAIKNVK